LNRWRRSEVVVHTYRMERKLRRADVLSWIRKPKSWTTVLLPALLVLAVFIAGRMVELHVYIEAIQGWIFSFGLWGPAVYLLIYVAAELAFLPGTPFTILAALFFGAFWGYVIMLTGATAAAVLGFLSTRYLFGERFHKRFADQEEFQKISAWIEKSPWLAIPFVRIMPIFPFSVNNYALGLTRITFRTYLLTSLAAFVPMTAVLVLGANALYRSMVQGEISWWLILGTTAAGLVVFVLGMLGKRAFHKES
jgi:uncharacterized membrane protein YdjX (TVP38/TMEM64 family)